MESIVFCILSFFYSILYLYFESMMHSDGGVLRRENRWNLESRLLLNYVRFGSVSGSTVVCRVRLYSPQVVPNQFRGVNVVYWGLCPAGDTENFPEFSIRFYVHSIITH